MAETEAAAAGRVISRRVDGRLVRGLGAGAPEAVTELCERFGPKLDRFVQAWLVGDGRAAEEVTILALLDAVRNVVRFDPRRSSFPAWLYGIARRKVHDELRRQRRRKSVPTSAQVSLESLAEARAPEDMADVLSSRIDAQRQVAALATVLSGVEFEVLVLSCVEQFSAPEIGRIVGRSGRAIHSILHRARQKARERLAHDG